LAEEGSHEIGPLEIEHVDLVHADEPGELERPLRFELHRIDLVLAEQDIFALLHFIALDDLIGLDRPHAGGDLLVADPLAARFVDLVEADLRARLGRGMDLDRDRDQRQPDLSLPIGTRRHPRLLAAKPIQCASGGVVPRHRSGRPLEPLP
jgi:hypothetical protein